MHRNGSPSTSWVINQRPGAKPMSPFSWGSLPIDGKRLSWFCVSRSIKPSLWQMCEEQLKTGYLVMIRMPFLSTKQRPLWYPHIYSFIPLTPPPPPTSPQPSISSLYSPKGWLSKIPTLQHQKLFHGDIENLFPPEPEVRLIPTWPRMSADERPHDLWIADHLEALMIPGNTGDDGGKRGHSGTIIALRSARRVLMVRVLAWAEFLNAGGVSQGSSGSFSFLA